MQSANNVGRIYTVYFILRHLVIIQALLVLRVISRGTLLFLTHFNNVNIIIIIIIIYDSHKHLFLVTFRCPILRALKIAAKARNIGQKVVRTLDYV